ncbi:TetR/AcrR family transcriptional regulator [Agreia sp.]|uniref:TetR/AcrR family transcriptional regulator n=1 Tax=Agreia sp. TaxID=1872416 RepID=UPI0035BC2515
MPKVTEQYREAKRDEIAEAALRCFAKKGFGASMADIISDTGLSAGAIYGHFESKHEVMLAVSRLIMASRIHDLEALYALERAAAPSEVLSRVLTGLARDVGDPGLLLQVWGRSIVETGMRSIVWEVFGELRNAYRRLFAAWAAQNRGLDETQALEWAEDLIPVAIGLAQGYIAQSALFPEFDGPAYLASVHELLPH